MMAKRENKRERNFYSHLREERRFSSEWMTKMELEAALGIFLAANRCERLQEKPKKKKKLNFHETRASFFGCEEKHKKNEARFVWNVIVEDETIFFFWWFFIFTLLCTTKKKVVDDFMSHVSSLLITFLKGNVENRINIQIVKKHLKLHIILFFIIN